MHVAFKLGVGEEEPVEGMVGPGLVRLAVLKSLLQLKVHKVREREIDVVGLGGDLAGQRAGEERLEVLEAGGVLVLRADLVTCRLEELEGRAAQGWRRASLPEPSLQGQPYRCAVCVA